MRMILLAAMIVIGLRATAAGREKPGNTTANPGADANNSFAMKLYERVGAGDGNVFFSPASLSVALAMTELGARGETRKQMDAVLGYDGTDPEKLQEGYAALYRRMVEAGGGGDAGGVQLKMANRLWPQKQYSFLPQFMADAKRLYDAAPEPLDFSADLDGARRTINQWVERQTADKIKELIKPGVLPNDTRLVLTNAVYFKGGWTDTFPKAATKDEPFHFSADKQIDVPMMRRTGEYRYGEDEAAQWLELPYAKGDVAMVVLLPRKVDGLPELTKGLDAKGLAQRIGAMAHRENVRVSLPRFKMTGAFELSGALSAIGMPLAFDSRKADFSGMTDQEALKISKVIHQAYVDVNEEGTEAAAASAVAMKPRAARLPAPPTEFKADRPFLFLIRDTKTGAILFLGRVADPKGA